MKLWDKGYSIDTTIERFTVGKDKELDLLLAPYDILGTIAHITMLEHVGLLSKAEFHPTPGQSEQEYLSTLTSHL